MTVTAVRKDPQALTMTIDAEFDASPERVWQLWADPRQLVRWWGPPTYPATFTKHDLGPGSRVEYHMTGPEGDQPRGYGDVVEINPPRSLVSETASPTTTARRTPISRSRPPGSRSRRSAAGGRGCRSRASSPAPRRWNRSSPGRRGGPEAGHRSDRRHPGRGRRVVDDAPMRSPAGSRLHNEPESMARSAP